MRANGKMQAREALIRALHGRLARKNARTKDERRREIRSVLVVRPDHLGDLLFATPALERIRQAFPRAHITGAVGPWGRAMWGDNPNLDALHSIPFPGMMPRTEGTPLSPYLLLGQEARRIASERYDLGIVLRFDHWWGASLLWAAGIPRRWGYNTPGMKSWLTDPVEYHPGRHEVAQNLALVTALTGSMRVGAAQMEVDRSKGQPPLRPPCPVAPPEGDFAHWAAASRRVVIHPGTGAANKLWTISGWAEVALKLEREGWSVALTGAPGERALAEAIVAKANNKPHNFVGHTADLAQLAWVLDKAQMVLGVDSGPLHIAAALNKPTLHLYGPSDETIWGPWGDPQMHRPFRAPGTRPTMRLDVGSRDLEGGPEMMAITTGMVLSEIEKLAAYA